MRQRGEIKRICKEEMALLERRFAEFLSKVEETGISPNLAPLVGHNSVRRLVMGEDF